MVRIARDPAVVLFTILALSPLTTSFSFAQSPLDASDRIKGDQPINVTTLDPWPAPPQPADPRSPLHEFERLIGESWTVTANTGREMHHAWKWGPGKFSIERWTEGESAQGDPWRELVVYYWHPQDKQVRILGISSYASGINRGTIDFDGTTATATSRLAQTRGIRDMQTRWRFESDALFHETLLEKEPSGKLVELVTLDHRREATIAKGNPSSDLTSLDISDEFSGLKFLFGDAWSSHLDGGQNAPVRTNINWIPIAKFLQASIHTEPSKPNSDLLANGYLYHDVESKSMRCLLLSADATIYEGVVQIPKEGTVQAQLTSSSPSAVTSITTSIEVITANRLSQTLRTTDASGPAMSISHER